MNKILWLILYITFASAMIAGAVLYFGVPMGAIYGIVLAVATMAFMFTAGLNGWNRLIWAVVCFANCLGLWVLVPVLFPALSPILVVGISFGGGYIVLNALYTWLPKRE